MIDPAASDPNRGYEMFGLDEVLLIYSPLASWTVQKLISHDVDIDDQTQEEIFWQLLEGLEFLHSIEIMHRDIKPLNMTVVSLTPGRIEARLIDFGWATNSLESYQYKVGTRPYLAPEILAGLDKRSQSGYDDRVDIFAFGLSMYQFFFRQPCTWERIDKDTRGKTNGNRLQDIHKQLFGSRKNQDLMKLISDCIFWDSRNRPSARQMMRLGGREQSVKNQGSITVSSHDKESDQVDGDDRLGNSIAKMSISGPGLTSSSMAGNSRDNPGTPRHERSLQHQSPAIRGPSEWNALGLDRWNSQ